MANILLYASIGVVWKSLPCAPDDIGDVFKVVWYAWIVGPLNVIISTIWVTVVPVVP